MTIARDSPSSHRLASKTLVTTPSSRLQEETEYECRSYFVDLSTLPASQLEHLRDCGLLLKQAEGEEDDNHHGDSSSSLDICLMADSHISYVQQAWSTEHNLRSSYSSLDASRPWLLYWALQSCDMMHHTPSEASCQLILNTLRDCWTSVMVDETAATTPTTKTAMTSSKENNSSDSNIVMGGFGGGVGQRPHGATTYAAVLALCILATNNQQHKSVSQQALSYLKEIRAPLQAWMMTLRETNNAAAPSNEGAVALCMHHDGEMDVRAAYCILAVAKLLNLAKPELTQGVEDYIVACQTYEGGFGGEPWSEAHGGNTFCATAALFLLGHFDKDSSSSSNSGNDGKRRANLPALMQWLAARQMGYEGGFSGRSNKLVDGCYSFWQGGAVAIVSRMNNDLATANSQAQDNNIIAMDPWLRDYETEGASSSYSSSLMMDEGMLERYVLLCAQEPKGGLRDKPSKHPDFYHTCYNLSGLSVAQHYGQISFGHATQTKLAQTHPCYNIRIDRVQSIVKHFDSLGAVE